MVKRILMNLLTNALKYGIGVHTDDEGYRGVVTLGARREGAFARITVKVTGRGISEGSLPNV